MTEEDPIKILKVRFAKGEISTAQYEEMLSYLLDDVSSGQKDPINDTPLTDIETDDPDSLDTSSDPVHSREDTDYDSDEPLGDDPISEGGFPNQFAGEEGALVSSSETVQADDTVAPESQYLTDAHLSAGIEYENRILEEQIEELEIIEETESESAQGSPSAIPGVFLSGQDLGNVCYVTAVNLIHAGEYDKALPFLEKSIEIDPDQPNAWLYRGSILHNGKQYEEALTCFNKALLLDGKLVKAALFKGYCLFNLHRDEEALNSFEQVINQERKHARAWLFKGYSLQNLKRFRDAAIAFESANQLNPKEMAGSLHQGICLFEI